jgi:hypothetical protein
MIEDLGPNPDLLDGTRKPPTTLRIPDDLKHILQNSLIERLAYHLADIDHWNPETGPKYNVDASVESMGNAVQNLGLSVRKRSQTGTLKSAITLAAKGEPIRLRRAVATMAAENPDPLGHGFIMPVSLLAELPESAFTRPQMASLWHLAEYLVRKVPSKHTFRLGPTISKYAISTNISPHKTLIASAVVNYGTLGHNAIFAHRIAEGAKYGLVESDIVDWLLSKLTDNTGSILKQTELNIEKLIKKKNGTNWSKAPSLLRLPTSAALRNWLEGNTECWTEMMNKKASAFEEYLLNARHPNWDHIRAAQYAMATINGLYGASHVTIFTQSVWGLFDHELISEDLAALQVHRMLREYLNGR